MKIEKLTILGKSDATITMILENLESNDLFPNINVINNLNHPIEHEINNKNFKIEFNQEIKDDLFFLGVYKPKQKKEVFDLFKKDIFKFLSIIHKSSQISSTTHLGIGCLINSLVSISSHTNLGNFVYVNRNSSIGHHTKIGDFVSLNPGVNIGGNVEIGEKTIIGIGSNVFNGVKIGKNSVIGGGSLVTRDIPDNVIAYGNPCKVIKKNET